MSCYHPKKAFQFGLTKNGRPNYIIASYNTYGIDSRNGSKLLEQDINESNIGYINYNHIEIPCGQCIGCRLDYSRSWANRCMLEMKEHESNYFVTITYDESSVPRSRSYSIKNDSGELNMDQFRENITLCKSDLQKFIKRLRKKTGQKIRYYACGEYGDTTGRSHYHVIFFGLELNDLVPCSKSNTGFINYTSKTIADCWKFGLHTVSPASWETCAYTARYVMKKLKGYDKGYYEANNIEPEFVVMSRKPGIGRDYYEKHKNNDLYLYEHICIGTGESAHKFKPPRYYDKLYDIEFPDNHSKRKEINKQRALDVKALKLSRTSKSYLELLKDEEVYIEKRTKQLKRKEI